MPFDATPAPVAQPPGGKQSAAVAALLAQDVSRRDSGAGGAPEDESLLCVVCLHELHCTLLIPCSHTVLCRGCADLVAASAAPECPMCRTPVDLVLDVN
jgi:hypothetical protein